MYDQEHYKELEFTLKFQPIDLSCDCGFVLGNAIKYILRAGHKDNFASDLAKARDYLSFLRKDLEENHKDLHIKLSPSAVLAAMHYCKENQLIDTLFANYTMPDDWYSSNDVVIELQDVKTCIHHITDLLEDD